MIKIYKNSTLLDTLDSGLEETSLSLESSDALNIHYYKPLTKFYFCFKTPSTTRKTLTIQRWNGTAYESVDFNDETKGFTKSGFITINDLDKSVLADGVHKIKISVNSTTSVVLRLLDIVFNSEQDLVIAYRDVNRLYPALMESHILAIIDARNAIIQKINSSGNIKINGIQNTIFNRWDLLNIDEVRQASVFYALHSIFLELSDEENDSYSEKAVQFLEKFNERFSVFWGSLLSLDSNDDGEINTNENQIQVGRFYY